MCHARPLHFIDSGDAIWAVYPIAAQLPDLDPSQGSGPTVFRLSWFIFFLCHEFSGTETADAQEDKEETILQEPDGNHKEMNK